MSTALTDETQQAVLWLNEVLGKKELFPLRGRKVPEGQLTTWRISPEPFSIGEDLYGELSALGDELLAFYRAVNLLYSHSRKRLQPEWVKRYLDLGKHDEVIRYGVMNRFRSDLPPVIRPDMIITSQGPVITELDSVPGGIGFLAAVNRAYCELGFDVVGGPDEMVKGFWEAVTEGLEDPLLAIVVSRESDDYRPEMTWLASALRDLGYRAVTVEPREVELRSQEGLFVNYNGKPKKADIIYRFFELFDLRNIPTADLILYAARKGMVRLLPPVKAYLEEKMLLALLHHPGLDEFWRQSLGEEVFFHLRKIIPMTWVLDPQPLPVQAVIYKLKIGGRPVASWDELREASKANRMFVLKPSGYSELAWGSRGVTVGHDVSNEEWKQAVDRTLGSFDTCPYVLQKFHTGKRFRVRYYDFASSRMVEMDGRVRLCPYYYVTGGRTRLAGVLATVCPPDKKAIHGMTEAVMVPCTVK